MSRHPWKCFRFFAAGMRRQRDIAYTGLWNTMLAVIFTLFWIMYELQITLTRMLTLNLIFRAMHRLHHSLPVPAHRSVDSKVVARRIGGTRGLLRRGPHSRGLRGLLDRWVCSVSPSRRRIFC